MNYFLSFLTLVLIQICCQAQNSPFIIDHLKLKDFDNKSILKTEKTTHFYEDDLYTANKTCNGEFGGKVTFRDKETGKKYSCNSTCAIIINKLNDNYYITSTLAHLSGFASVQVVKDPKLLESNTGTEILVKSIGSMTLGSFTYNDQLFHITTDRKGTYISKILNNKYIILDTLLNESLFMYNPSMRKDKNGHYVSKIQYLTNKSQIARKKIEGYIVIKDNKIQIVKK